jgi:hypothetical protein
MSSNYLFYYNFFFKDHNISKFTTEDCESENINLINNKKINSKKYTIKLPSIFNFYLRKICKICNSIF